MTRFYTYTLIVFIILSSISLSSSADTEGEIQNLLRIQTVYSFEIMMNILL